MSETPHCVILRRRDGLQAQSDHYAACVASCTAKAAELTTLGTNMSDQELLDAAASHTALATSMQAQVDALAPELAGLTALVDMPQADKDRVDAIIARLGDQFCHQLSEALIHQGFAAVDAIFTPCEGMDDDALRTCMAVKLK